MAKVLFRKLDEYPRELGRNSKNHFTEHFLAYCLSVFIELQPSPLARST